MNEMDWITPANMLFQMFSAFLVLLFRVPPPSPPGAVPAKEKKKKSPTFDRASAYRDVRTKT